MGMGCVTSTSNLAPGFSTLHSENTFTCLRVVFPIHLLNHVLDAYTSGPGQFAVTRLPDDCPTWAMP